MPDFNIPDFLRTIGKGPEQKPEWWWVWEGDPELLIDARCPFADILTDWTPDKDALLLGAGLEYEREHGNSNCGWYIFTDPKPGERLARAIWAAMGDGK